MRVFDTANLVLRSACTVQRIHIHALRKTTLPVSDIYIRLHYNTFMVVQ